LAQLIYSFQMDIFYDAINEVIARVEEDFKEAQVPDDVLHLLRKVGRFM
jgi:hypothetical protein